MIPQRIFMRRAQVRCEVSSYGALHVFMAETLVTGRRHGLCAGTRGPAAFSLGRGVFYI